jgi:hypothetical protein
MRKGWRWLVPLVGACQPNPGGLGSSSANTLGDGPVDTGDAPTSGAAEGSTGGNGDGLDDGVPTDSGGDPGGPPDDTAGPGDTAATTDDPPTTEGDPPTLSISDGPTYDFGNIDVGGQASHLFTVTNEGDAEATGLGGTVMPPFALPGGFPGAGTCGASLASNTSCTVEVTFTPPSLGPHTGGLAVHYDAGPDALRDVVGGGAGQSDNLLMNPGGESTGNPPPQWSELGTGNWMAGNPWPGEPDPFVGAAHLAAYNGNNGQNFTLFQDVGVGDWSAAIDLGALRFAFEGHACSFASNDDDYRIRVIYRDAGGTALDTWTAGWVSTNTWQLYTDARLAPINTRAVRVELACDKSGGDYCDAFFDELELRAVYP